MTSLSQAWESSENAESRSPGSPRVAIIGAGIGGLVLALELHRLGLNCRVYEAAPKLQPLGVGLNLLPHATKILHGLGLEPQLKEAAVTTRESVYYNRFGQLIHAEPSGRFAGYSYPQFSMHRGDLQEILLEAVQQRLGQDAVITDHRCTSVSEHEDFVEVKLIRDSDKSDLPSITADVVVGCDGVHSAIRAQFYPDEGDARYSGVTMWRGAVKGQPFLSGASMARIGWLAKGKMVIYPIRNEIDRDGNQLINWVAEIETPQRVDQDWTHEGYDTDFIHAFEDQTFDWLDVPALIRGTEKILEYPMVDRDPIGRWTFGRVTLLGDAAHPMVPRGSNGAGQAILDARNLAEKLSSSRDARNALSEYEAERLPRTSAVVLANRTVPPDALIREVWERTNDQPFGNIDDVISNAEIVKIIGRYQKISGNSLDPLGPNSATSGGSDSSFDLTGAPQSRGD